MNVFELAAKLTLDKESYERGLRSAADEAKEFGKKLDSGINKILKIGAVAAGAAVAGVVAFSKAAVNTGMQFDTAMSQVAATMGVTVDEIQELRDYAQQMGASTVFSATQAAQALNYMALAGYDAEKSMNMLPAVLNLAAAGNFDLARASDMVTDAESALGLTTEEAAAMVDQMARAASRSNTSVEQLGEAFLTIGGTARFMSGGTDRLATVLGILADNGIKGSEAGTHLRNMLLKLSAPTAEGERIIEQLGLEIFDASGNMRDMEDIILDLDEALDGMTNEERVNIISELFNARDIAAVNALLGTSKERWDELGESIANSSGAAQQMAETQLDNLNGDLTLMNSALEGAKIAFSDGITPALRNLVQMVTKALSNPKTTKFLTEAGAKIGEVATKLAQLGGGLLTRVINLFKNGAPQLKAFAASFAALTIAIKAYSAASKLAANGTTLITSAIKFMSSPLGAVITALGALTAVLGVAAVRASRTAKSYGILTDAERDQLQATQDLADAYSEGRDERIRGMREIDNETERTRALWEELQTLVDENGKVIGSKERAREITDELNGSLGTEFQWNEDNLENYLEQAAAIDNLINKKRAMRQIDVAEENYDAAKEQLPEIQENIYNAERELNALEARRAEAQRNLDMLPEDASDRRLYQAQEELARINTQIEETQKVLDENRELERQALGDISAYYDAYEAYVAGDYEAVNKILEADTYQRLMHKAETEQITSDELNELKRGRDIAQATLDRYLADVESGNAEYNEKVAQEMRDNVDGFDQAIATQEQMLLDSLSESAPEAESSGWELVNSFINGMLDGEGFVAAAAAHLSSVAARNLNSGGGEGPGYAGGLDYVPYDNYAANLHRGEAVLTAREAEEWRRGEGSGRQIVNNFTFNGVSQSDLDMIVAYVNRGVVMG